MRGVAIESVASHHLCCNQLCLFFKPSIHPSSLSPPPPPVSLDDRLEALATANPTSRVKLAIEAAEKALALVRSTLAGIQGGGRRGGAAAR